MIFNETYTLSNGVNIPKLGLGTWSIDDASASEEEGMERLKAFTPIKDYGEYSRFPVFSGR